MLALNNCKGNSIINAYIHLSVNSTINWLGKHCVKKQYVSNTQTYLFTFFIKSDSLVLPYSVCQGTKLSKV